MNNTQVREPITVGVWAQDNADAIDGWEWRYTAVFNSPEGAYDVSGLVAVAHLGLEEAIEEACWMLCVDLKPGDFHVNTIRKYACWSVGSGVVA